jgi:hypothetical protein
LGDNNIPLRVLLLQAFRGKKEIKEPVEGSWRNIGLEKTKHI